MNDRNIALVESDVRRLIERTRGVDSVPAEARARVLARVESVVSASGADIRRAGSGGRASGLRDWMRRLSPYVTTFVVGAATGAMAMRQGARMRSVATHESTSLDRAANDRRHPSDRPRVAGTRFRARARATRRRRRRPVRRRRPAGRLRSRGRKFPRPARESRKNGPCSTQPEPPWNERMEPRHSGPRENMNADSPTVFWSRSARPWSSEHSS